jgi:hypothetical protein
MAACVADARIVPSCPAIPVRIGPEVWYWRVASPGELSGGAPACYVRERLILLPDNSAAQLAGAVTVVSNRQVRSRRASAASVPVAVAEPLPVPAMAFWPAGAGMPAVRLRVRRGRVR